MGRALTTEEFVLKAKEVHGDKYMYNDTVYTHSQAKLKITCPEHGEFCQTPSNHLKGTGCPECYKLSKKMSLDTFITKSNEKHNNKYTYENTVYVDSHTKIKINCPDHGEFEQKPYTHLQGTGCPACAQLLRGWSYSVWEEAGNKSNHFIEFYVYIIECWNDDERFIKIGKSFTSMSNRFRGEHMPYEWKLLKKYEGSARYISELEVELHNKHKEHKYTPNVEFKGMYECFNANILQLLKKEGVIP